MPSPEAFPSLIFYGGDIPGIVQRLDYLQSLGVNALYLNPIFTAFTNHKYDVIDYEQVDPHLGGNEALIALRRALDERDMHYILDIVPNHAGYWHPWFQSARQNPNAPEAEFFTFHQHPDHYASWLGVWTLPKLNYRSQELRRRVYAGPKATFRYWLQPPYSADGWRIDVANMLARQGADQMGEEVARGIRQAVKQTRPDAYLLGENFFDAVQQLQGDQWDGVMNYQGLKSPLLHWLRGYRQGSHGMKEQIHSPVPWTTIALEGTWRTQRAAIPWAIALQQYNLVDSHDTQRIRSAVEGNDALHRLAGVVQFTYPGVPGIYYGDEIGMADLPVLGPRGCMPWDEGRWDHGLLQFYKQLIALRRQSTTLQHGGFQIISLEEDSFTYQRESNHGRILVIANRSIHPRPAGPLPVAHAGIPEGTRFVEYFTNQEARVEGSAVQMPELPQGATIWTEIH
jgi:alpha-glucosidase